MRSEGLRAPAPAFVHLKENSGYTCAECRPGARASPLHGGGGERGGNSASSFQRSEWPRSSGGPNPELGGLGALPSNLIIPQGQPQKDRKGHRLPDRPAKRTQTKSIRVRTRATPRTHNWAQTPLQQPALWIWVPGPETMSLRPPRPPTHLTKP